MQLNRKRPAIFYGWWIVIASFLIMVLIGGFVFMGFTAFFEPIASEFGWSYTQISLAASFRGFELGLLAPIVGLFIDRWGTRKLFIGGIILVGFGLLFLSQIKSLAMYYTAFVLIAVGVSGTSITAVMATAANWFRDKLGLVIGIINSGVAISGLLVPLVVKLIDSYGWRNAVLIMAITTWVLGIPLSLVIRHKPQPYGYLPYGEKRTTTTGGVVVSAYDDSGEQNISLKKALGSRTFWHIAIAMMLLFAATSAVNAHSMPFLSSVGIDRATGSLIAMSLSVASIGGRFGSGWLVDKFSAKPVAIGFSILVALGLLSAIYASNLAMWVILPFVIFSSTGWGGNTTLRVSLTNGYFGRKNFGAIFGSLMGLVAAGQVAGPLIAGWIFDTFASYHIAWLSFAIIALAAMVILWTMPPLSQKQVTASKH
jgi:sugar phosphate permease